MMRSNPYAPKYPDVPPVSLKARPFVLFESNPATGRVLAAHAPSLKITRNENFWTRLGFTSKQASELYLELIENPVQFVTSPMGLGVISARFDLWTGLCLYLHLDSTPSSEEPTESALSLSTPFCPNRHPLDFDPVELTVRTLYATMEGFSVHDGPPESRLDKIISCLSTMMGAPVLKDDPIPPDLGGQDFAISVSSPNLLPLDMTIVLIFSWLAILMSYSSNGEFRYSVITEDYLDHELPSVLIQTVTTKSRLIDKNGSWDEMMSVFNHLSYKCDLQGVCGQPTLDLIRTEEECKDPSYFLCATMKFTRHPAKAPMPWLKTDFSLYD